MEQGNSVVAIEHNLDVIKTADHIFYLDLDPGGGVRGREDVAQAGGGGCSRRELYRPVPVPNHDNFST